MQWVINIHWTHLKYRIKWYSMQLLRLYQWTLLIHTALYVITSPWISYLISCSPSPTRFPSHRMSYISQNAFHAPSLSLGTLHMTFFPQNTLPHFTLKTSTCPSEFSSDNIHSRRLSRFPRPSLRQVPLPCVPVSLSSGVQLHVTTGDNSKSWEGGRTVKLGYEFLARSLLCHCRLTVSSTHGHSSC